MPDNQENQGTQNQGGGQAGSNQQQNQPPAGITGVSDAELTEMRRKVAKYDEIEDAAKESGFDSAGDYVIGMEDKIFDMREKPNADGSQGTDDPKPPQPPPQSPPKPDASQPGLSADDKQLLQNAVTAGFRGDLQSQFVEYRMDQNGLPEDQRSPFQKQELFDVVTKKGALVTEMLRDANYGGNVFNAAAAVLVNLKGTEAQRQQRSEASNDGLNNAANSATVQTGGPTPQPSTQTNQDAAAQANADAARTIAPPTKYVMPKD